MILYFCCIQIELKLKTLILIVVFAMPILLNAQVPSSKRSREAVKRQLPMIEKELRISQYLRSCLKSGSASFICLSRPKCQIEISFNYFCFIMFDIQTYILENNIR